MKRYILTLIAITVLIFTFPQNFQSINHAAAVECNDYFLKGSSTSQFISCKPYPSTVISITNNQDFISGGYVGNGTKNNPYQIANFSIQNNSSVLISVVNTSVYFIIYNVSIDGLGSESIGINFENVTHGTITNVSINNCRIGIKLIFFVYGTISNVKIHDNSEEGVLSRVTRFNLFENISTWNNGKNGISLICGRKNNVSKCHVYNNQRDGIHSFIMCSNQRFNDNIIHDNKGNGISITDKNDYLTIEHNSVYNNNASGIEVRYQSDGNKIYDNIIIGNKKDGITMTDTVRGNIVTNNTLSDNGNCGINLQSSSFGDCHANHFQNNTFRNNSNHGISLGSFTRSHTVSWNTFIGNNYGNKSQAKDDSLFSTFSFNYWSDCSNLDSDADGLNDVKYKITGTANNNDVHALIVPKKPLSMSFLTLPLFVNPQNGFYVLYWYDFTEYHQQVFPKCTEICIMWQSVSHSQNLPVIYSLEYSNNEGKLWNSLITNFTRTTYCWDLLGINKRIYQLRLTAYSQNNQIEIISEPFCIYKQHCDLLPPIIISPTQNTSCSGMVNIKWQPAFYDWNYPVVDITFRNYSFVYSVYIIDEDTQEQMCLISGLNATEYMWNTSNHKLGRYSIVVVVGKSGPTERYEYCLVTIHQDSSTIMNANSSNIMIFVVLFIAGILGIYKRRC